MIHVSYGIYDRDGRYSKFVGTSMVSLFENLKPPPPAPSVTVHILHDNTLSEENRDKFNLLVGRYGQAVKFYNVEKLVPEKIEDFRQMLPNIDKSVFSIGTLYRLLIPHVFSDEIKKVIHIDADTVVNLDINELWQIDIHDKPLAAVPEVFNGTDWNKIPIQICVDGVVKGENYFNTGILVLNMDAMRESKEIVRDAVKFVTQHPQYVFFDQDALSYCFEEKYLKLPVKFNRFVERARNAKEELESKIYHYIWINLQMDTKDKFNRLWFKYFAKTPWFDEEIFSHIYEGVRQVHDSGKMLALRVSALMSGKNRAFFMPPEVTEIMKKNFAINEDEEIIEAVSADSMQKLFRAMKKSRGKKVFFILVGNYLPVYAALVKEGFTPVKDFVNGFEFLSEAHGVPFNSYPLIKLL